MMMVANLLLRLSFATTARRTSFLPGVPWPDTSGATIDAHGAGLLTVGDQTYWYGSQRHGHPNVPNGTHYPKYAAYCYPPPPPDAAAAAASHLGVLTHSVTLGDGYTEGVNLYVADGDLYNWKRIGLVFAANETGAHCLERPKVIQCPGSGKYVLWAKGFTPDGNVKAVVATAETALGPFKLLDPAQPFYAPANTSMADATLYVEAGERGEKGVPWLFWRSRNQGFLAARLQSDCTAIEAGVPPISVASKQHEAPAVFHYNRRAYLWTSATSGFQANAAQLLVSQSGSLAGPWVADGNPTKDSTTFDSQSTYVLRNPSFMSAEKTPTLPQFLYLGDRWETKTTNFGRYVWLPLFIDETTGAVRVPNETSWHYG